MPESEKTEDKQSRHYPTPFQKRTLWNAITALAIVAIGLVAVGLVMLTSNVLGFLQPVLVPIAVAGIIAYLLEPIIRWLQKKGWSHGKAMMTVYVGFLIVMILLIIAVIVPTVGQAREFVEKREVIQERVVTLFQKGYGEVQDRFDMPEVKKYGEMGLKKLSEFGPKIGAWIWGKISGLLGFFGYVLGLFLVPLYLFFFLREGHSISEKWADYLPLKASQFKDEVVSTLREINQYLISFFRGQMVVSLIDGALVALVLSFVIFLPYGLLLGVFLAILGLIPYIGNLMVMIPAVLIAVAHFGASATGPVTSLTEPVVGEVVTIQTEKGEIDDKIAQSVKTVYFTPEGKVISKEKPEIGKVATFEGADGQPVEKVVTAISKTEVHAEVLVHAWNWLPQVWAYPLIVLGIFIVLQQVNGLVTAPKIVGDSVGLHPLTVIFSVLFWSLLLGGLLGALLAVPLTAAIKVLFRRYIWEKRIEGQLVGSQGAES